jgi:uncharacterized protein YndB with AHSA1/START domain
MPPKLPTVASPFTGMASDSRLVIDRITHTITMTRSFTAPRELVFDAWTQPEQVACWWDASGEHLAECEIDLRAGGAFKFVNQGTSDAPPLVGKYREIAPPGKLVFEAMGAIGTVALEDFDGGTVMTVSIKCTSGAHLEQFVAMGVDVGTSQTLDNLVCYIGTKWR